MKEELHGVFLKTINTIFRFVQKFGDSLFYARENIRAAKDFNITSQYFRIGVFPRPVRTVSQRVRQIVLKNKIK